MAAVYTSLLPTGDLISYTSATPAIEYPASNVIAVLGPVFPPKL